MTSIADFDRLAQQEAQLQFDAEQGHKLMHNLERTWTEQGYNARIFGFDRDHQGLWSPFHQQGWDLADGMIEAELSEADAKPFGDPLPVPAWDELLAQIA